MVPHPGCQLLFEQARSIAGELGWKVAETSVGGASDGNFVAALGRPVLDGLGAVGGGAHARHKARPAGPRPSRTALMAELLMACAQ
jgi:glutamate carboxypeptidase